MGNSNNNMAVIGHKNINKGYNYNSNGVITSIIGTQQGMTSYKVLDCGYIKSKC